MVLSETAIRPNARRFIGQPTMIPFIVGVLHFLATLQY
jgi:hypothetical protein